MQETKQEMLKCSYLAVSGMPCNCDSCDRIIKAGKPYLKYKREATAEGLNFTSPQANRFFLFCMKCAEAEGLQKEAV